MPISYRFAGSILDDPSEGLVCPVNTIGVCGAGLAAEFKRRYPRWYFRYKKQCREHFLIGDVMFWRDESNPRRFVLAFPTKRHWAQPSDLGYLQSGLPTLCRAILKNSIKSVAVPALGCGLGGLPWPAVRDLMEANLHRLGDACDVTIYLPQRTRK